MNSRTAIRILFFIFLIVSANMINAQKSYNVRKFSIYVPSGWKLMDHDVHLLEISSTKTMFMLYFYVISNDEIETRWRGILNSLSKGLEFEDETCDKGEYDLESGFHLIYGYCNARLKDGGENVKLITSQLVNDRDYAIIMFGFCRQNEFNACKNELMFILDNIKYKEE